MAIEIVDFPIKNGGSFHCYVSSPEGRNRDSNGQKAVPKNQAVGEAGVQRTMLHAVTCRKTCQEMSEAYRLSFR